MPIGISSFTTRTLDGCHSGGRSRQNGSRPADAHTPGRYPGPGLGRPGPGGTIGPCFPGQWRGLHDHRRAGATDTSAYGINGAGQIVGGYTGSGGLHGFLDSGGVFTTVDVPGANNFTLARGINGVGQIVGIYSIAVVPEPSGLVLLGIGALTLLACAARRRARPRA
jgi:hypothetical protein